jgi:hypothetical protein
VANSRRGHIIRRGCREWAKKEDILIYHVQTIWKRKDAEAIGYWIRDLDLRIWSARVTEAFRLQAFSLAHNHDAYAAYELLCALQRELSIAGQQYDLSDIARFIAASLSHRIAGRLIWRRGETWKSRDNAGL